MMVGYIATTICYREVHSIYSYTTMEVCVIHKLHIATELTKFFLMLTKVVPRKPMQYPMTRNKL